MIVLFPHPPAVSLLAKEEGTLSNYLSKSMESLVKMKHSVSRSNGSGDTDEDKDRDKPTRGKAKKNTNRGHQQEPYQHHQSIIKVSSGQGLAT